MTRTITAIYDSREQAEAARSQLTAAGVGPGEVQITSNEQGGASSAGGQDRGRGFLQGLKDFFMPDEDRHAYSEGVRRGGYLLTARVEESRADTVCRILDDSGAVDFDARQAQWRSEGWSGRDAQRRDSDMRDETIPVVEEELRVGKREVERGSVRVRSYVEEAPVQEQVNLREERVEVERRPVGERISEANADNLFEERSIELTERGEEAVVAKEAVIREEIGIRKDVDERTETISDTVRRTEVDVEDTRGQGLRGDRGTRDEDRRADQGVQGERASFDSDDDDRSIAMDPEGSRIEETAEERRERLERERRSDRRPF